MALHTQLVRRLRELIAALDRRTPRAGDAGEAAIARESAALRTEALRRIGELDTAATPVAGRADDRDLPDSSGEAPAADRPVA